MPGYLQDDPDQSQQVQQWMGQPQAQSNAVQAGGGFTPPAPASLPTMQQNPANAQALQGPPQGSTPPSGGMLGSLSQAQGSAMPTSNGTPGQNSATTSNSGAGATSNSGFGAVQNSGAGTVANSGTGFQQTNQGGQPQSQTRAPGFGQQNVQPQQQGQMDPRTRQQNQQAKGRSYYGEQ